VISKTHEDFRAGFDALPKAIQKQAREKFHLWLEEPFNPSLQFKELLQDVCGLAKNRERLCWSKFALP
jgi:hypothetical protein